MEGNSAAQKGIGPAAEGSAVLGLVLSLTRELLERADIGPQDDFFSVGGDSVTAMHLVGRLARRTETRLRVSLLFGSPVLAEFAEAVEALGVGAPAAVSGAERAV